MASLIKISLLLAIAPLFVAAFCTCELNLASAVAPSVQSLYHAALAETLVDSPQSLSSLEPAAGSSTTGQYQRYDNTGGSNYSSELEVPRGIFASLWRHLANPLPMGTSTVYAKSSTVSSHSQVQHSTAPYCNVYFDGHSWRVLQNCSKFDSRRLHNNYWYQSSSPWFTGVKVSFYCGTYKPEQRYLVHFRSYRPNVFALTFWKYAHQVFEPHGTTHFPVIQKLSLA